MNVTWVSADELMAMAAARLKPARTVLDIGCGIQPQQMLKPLIHICCEPFLQYVEKLQEKAARIHDRSFVILNASWADVVNIFPAKSVDTIFLVDVIEHLEKDEALQLLRRTEEIARRQIAIFTPLGFMPQVHADGRDAWGLDGGAWQEHKSGWQPYEFDASWQILAAKQFHNVDSMLQKLETPFGALWAIKTYAETGPLAADTFKSQRLHALLHIFHGVAYNCRASLAKLFLKH